MLSSGKTPAHLREGVELMEDRGTFLPGALSSLLRRLWFRIGLSWECMKLYVLALRSFLLVAWWLRAGVETACLCSPEQGWSFDGLKGKSKAGGREGEVKTPGSP